MSTLSGMRKYRSSPKLKTALFHAGGWLLFILYEQLSVMVVTKDYLPSIGMIYFYLVNIGLFYAQASILDRCIGKEKPDYTTGIFFMAIVLLTTMALKIIGELVIDNGKHDYTRHPDIARTVITLDFLRSIFYMVIATTYWTVSYNYRLRKNAADERIRQLTMAGTNATLQVKLSHALNAYLQQQMSPHLLFNTLNFVYSRVHKSAPDGGRAIYLLTEILYFSLRKKDESGRAALEAEIRQIRNLIDLNRYRFDFELPLELIVTGDPSAHRIIPLVLLTLVENMFVHGDFKDKPAAIAIAVSAAGALYFETENTIRESPSTRGRGTGLANIRTRLEHFYGDRFQLHIDATGAVFKTKLTIQL